MPTALVPAGEAIPVAINGTEAAIAATTEETPPKRGRGRPPGAKNKPKTVKPVSEPVPVPPVEEEEEEEEEEQEQVEPEEVEPVEPEEDEEEEEEEEEPPRTPPPPPTPKQRRPRAPPKKHPRVAEIYSPPAPPESPRTRKRRVQGEYRDLQATVHAQRRDRLSSLLERFMY